MARNIFHQEIFLQTKFRLLVTKYFITESQFSCSDQRGMSSVVPTSNDHNFLVRSPFHAFVDSKESHLSLKSIYIWLNII